MKPKFSIIIPVYNVAPYLCECLDSVLVQNFGDWEAICIDDGSTDGSGSVLDEYAARDSRFHVAHVQNGGVSSARNKALDMSQGEWIMFIDGDDCYNPDAFGLVAKAIEHYPECEIVSYGLSLFIDGDTPRWNGVFDGAAKLFDISKSLNSDFCYKEFSGKAYSRGLVSGIRFDESLGNGEDLLFLAECVAKSDCIAIMDFPLYAYRQRSSSVTHCADSTRKAEECLISVPKWFVVYFSSGKEIKRNQVTCRIVRLTKGYVCDLLRMRIAVDKKAHLCDEWLKMFSGVFNETIAGHISFWDKLRIFAAYAAIRFMKLIFKLIKSIVAMKVSLRYKFNELCLRVASRNGVVLGPKRRVAMIGMPLIECCKGGEIEIGDGCILGSRSKGYHLNLFAPVKLKISRPAGRIKIGERTRIYGSCIHAFNSIAIGHDVLIAGNCQIFDSNGHENSWDDLSLRANSKDDGREIVIEDYVWVGAGSMILPGVKIGKGSIVAAGSVVNKDVPPMSLAAGVPAKVVKSLEG